MTGEISGWVAMAGGRTLLDGDGFGEGERNFIVGNDDRGIGTERAQQLSMLYVITDFSESRNQSGFSRV